MEAGRRLQPSGKVSRQRYRGPKVGRKWLHLPRTWKEEQSLELSWVKLLSPRDNTEIPSWEVSAVLWAMRIIKGSRGRGWIKRWSFRRSVWQQYTETLEEKGNQGAMWTHTTAVSGTGAEDVETDRVLREDWHRRRIRKVWRQTPSEQGGREKERLFTEDLPHSTAPSTGEHHCLCGIQVKCMPWDSYQSGHFHPQCVPVWIVY